MIQIAPPIPMYPLGVLKTYYLNMPTGVTIDFQGDVKLESPIKFLKTLAAITDDHDLAKKDQTVRVPIQFEE